MCVVFLKVNQILVSVEGEWELPVVVCLLCFAITLLQQLRFYTKFSVIWVIVCLRTGQHKIVTAEYKLDCIPLGSEAKENGKGNGKARSLLRMKAQLLIIFSNWELASVIISTPFQLNVHASLGNRGQGVYFGCNTCKLINFQIVGPQAVSSLLLWGTKTLTFVGSNHKTLY